MTDAQKICVHKFIGRADGVHCTCCGLKLSAEDYFCSLKSTPKLIVNTEDMTKTKFIKRTKTKKKEGSNYE